MGSGYSVSRISPKEQGLSETTYDLEISDGLGRSRVCFRQVWLLHCPGAIGSLSGILCFDVSLMCLEKLLLCELLGRNCSCEWTFLGIGSDGLLLGSDGHVEKRLGYG